MLASIPPFNSSLNVSFHSSSSVLPLRNSSFHFFDSFFNSSSLRSTTKLEKNWRIQHQSAPVSAWSSLFLYVCLVDVSAWVCSLELCSISATINHHWSQATDFRHNVPRGWEDVHPTPGPLWRPASASERTRQSDWDWASGAGSHGACDGHQADADLHARIRPGLRGFCCAMPCPKMPRLRA